MVEISVRNRMRSPLPPEVADHLTLEEAEQVAALIYKARAEADINKVIRLAWNIGLILLLAKQRVIRGAAHVDSRQGPVKVLK